VKKPVRENLRLLARFEDGVDVGHHEDLAAPLNEACGPGAPPEFLVDNTATFLALAGEADECLGILRTNGCNALKGFNGEVPQRLVADER
jgi:hypothetical protein